MSHNRVVRVHTSFRNTQVSLLHIVIPVLSISLVSQPFLAFALDSHPLRTSHTHFWCEYIILACCCSSSLSLITAEYIMLRELKNYVRHGMLDVNSLADDWRHRPSRPWCSEVLQTCALNCIVSQMCRACVRSVSNVFSCVTLSVFMCFMCRGRVRVCAQCVKCVTSVCTVCQVCHKCVHMCPADLCSVPNVFCHLILCARCVSLIFTVCPMCYRVSRCMWRCVAMCVCNVRMCVYVTLLTDSSVSASGELTDAFYDVICA